MKLASRFLLGPFARGLRLSMMGTMLALAATQASAACIADPIQPVGAWTMPTPSPGTARFETLQNLSCQAVLDRNTGLVWEQTPLPNLYAWPDAIIRCTTSMIGGVMGWRLPSVEELSTLVVSGGTTMSGTTYGLPTGHPFGSASGTFWAASTLVSDSTLAWYWTQPFFKPWLSISTFPPPPVPWGTPLNVATKGTQNRAWCVRAA